MAEKTKISTKFQQPFSVPKVRKSIKPIIPVNKTNPTTSENVDSDILERSEQHQKKPEVSSMTDEQYDILFDAVLNLVRSTPTDELIASLPKKEEPSKRKPKKMKKVKSISKVEVQVDEDNNNIGDESMKDDIDIVVEEILKVPNNTQSSEAAVAENVEDSNTMANKEEEVSQGIHSVDASASHNLMVETSHDAMYMINLQSLSGEDTQGLNETTPEGSELEFEAVQPPHQETPPRKMKKSNKNSSSKKQKLAPRQLLFPKQLNTDTEIKKKKEKQKKMSLLRKEKQKKVSSESQRLGLTHRTSHNQEKDEKQIIVLKQSRKEQMMMRDIETLGTWVQCCQPTCLKWRYLSDVNDPTEIPEKWTCSLNTDENFNSCEKQQQQYNEENHIFTKYTEGSIVWARMTGYPWWPAMIEIDPDTESYFELVTEASMIPSHYHVVFFDTKVSRAWVKSSSVLPFNCKEELVNSENKRKKGHNFQKEVNAAKKNAQEALQLPIQTWLINEDQTLLVTLQDQDSLNKEKKNSIVSDYLKIIPLQQYIARKPTNERLKKFSFSVRFVGKWGKTESSDERPGIIIQLRGKSSSSKLITIPLEETKKSLQRKNREKENADINLDMLDLSMVDEIMSDADSVLKGIEEAMESLDSQEETKPAKTKKCTKDAKREGKKDQSNNDDSGKNDCILDKLAGKRKHKESNKRKIAEKNLKKPKLTEAFDCDVDTHSDTEVRQPIKAKSSKKSLFAVPESKAKTKICTKDAKRKGRKDQSNNDDSGKNDCILDKLAGKGKHKESKKRKIAEKDLKKPKLTEAFDCDVDAHSDTEVRQPIKAKSLKKSLFAVPESKGNKVNCNEEIKQKTKESTSDIKVKNRNKNRADTEKQGEGFNINGKSIGKKKETMLQNLIKKSVPKNEANADPAIPKKTAELEKTTSNSDSNDISCFETRKDEPVKKKLKMPLFVAPKAANTAIVPDKKIADKCAEPTSDAGEQLVPDPESQLVDNIDSDEINLDIPVIEDVIKSQEMVVQELVPLMTSPIEMGNESDPFDMEE